MITECEALIRPGRVDKIIEIGYCTDDQVIRLVQNFYGDSNVPDDIVNCKQVTPAQIIKLLQKYPDDPDKFWEDFTAGYLPNNSTVEQTLGSMQNPKKKKYRRRERYRPITDRERYNRVDRDLGIYIIHTLKIC